MSQCDVSITCSLRAGGHRHANKVWHLARNETDCGKAQQALIHSNSTAEACSQVTRTGEGRGEKEREIKLERGRGEGEREIKSWREEGKR